MGHLRELREEAHGIGRRDGVSKHVGGGGDAESSRVQVCTRHGSAQHRRTRRGAPAPSVSCRPPVQRVKSTDAYALRVTVTRCALTPEPCLLLPQSGGAWAVGGWRDMGAETASGLAPVAACEPAACWATMLQSRQTFNESTKQKVKAAARAPHKSPRGGYTVTACCLYSFTLSRIWLRRFKARAGYLCPHLSHGGDPVPPSRPAVLYVQAVLRRLGAAGATLRDDSRRRQPSRHTQPRLSASAQNPPVPCALARARKGHMYRPNLLRKQLHSTLLTSAPVSEIVNPHRPRCWRLWGRCATRRAPAACVYKGGGLRRSRA